MEDPFNFYWSTVSIWLILVQGRPQHRLCVGIFCSLASGHSIGHQVQEFESSRLRPKPHASRALGLIRSLPGRLMLEGIAGTCGSGPTAGQKRVVSTGYN